MSLIRGDALSIPLRDESVDLIVTSPPYFALRSYTDDGEHYPGQIGSEPTPSEFLAALWFVTAECKRVLKPSGSLWLNLGDKYAGSGGHNNANLSGPSPKSTLGGSKANRTGTEGQTAARRSAPDRYNQDSGGVPAKSLMGLPWRYAIGCIDDLGLILRAEVIWSKPNGLPESVTDRVRRSHEQWFHFTKEPRYFSAVDEVREPHTHAANGSTFGGTKSIGAAEIVGASERRTGMNTYDGLNPLGKLPGSVWTVATEPLRVPDDLPQHFAAFPSEWPKRIIQGWSPSGICVECDQGRRPVVDRQFDGEPNHAEAAKQRQRNAMNGGMANVTLGVTDQIQRTITGYSCACTTPDAPTRPAVVLDPFAGTGTTPAVARALGRTGIGLDLSADYLRLARWRINDPKLRAKALGVDPPKPEVAGQLGLLEIA